MMDNDDFNHEMRYWITMSFVKQLKCRGIFSDTDYQKIDSALLKKYRPVLGLLLSDNGWTL